MPLFVQVLQWDETLVDGDNGLDIWETMGDLELKLTFELISEDVGDDANWIFEILEPDCIVGIFSSKVVEFDKSFVLFSSKGWVFDESDTG